MAGEKGILVIGEVTEEGSLGGVTGELLAVARRLAEGLGAEVSVALLGKNATELAKDAIALGADKVSVSEDALLHDQQVDAHLSALQQISADVNPEVIISGRTLTGRDIGPRLAFRLGVALMQDCVDVAVDSTTKRVIATRPVYGGNALARVSSPGDPQFVCVRPMVFEALQPDSSRQGEVIQAQISLDATVVKVRRVEQVKEESTGIKLEEAKVVVSVGRGIGGEENLPPFQDLAKTLGAALGASRAVVDAGWLDHSYQVGLTGKSIAPDLYLTWAISGASQHMAGCSNSKVIVAVNRDKDANIFKDAQFGVVGEWQKVLPGFSAMVAELIGS